MTLPRWMLNCFCAVVGAAIAMTAVTAFESGQEAKALAYGLYAFIAAFVVVASHEQKVEGWSDHDVISSLVIFVLATIGGGASFIAQVFWPWGIGMMFGIMLNLPWSNVPRVRVR